VRRPIKWGKVAAPTEPHIVTLLKLLRSRDSPSQTQSTLAEFDAILGRWAETKSLDELRSALGVVGKRGAPRTQRTVDRRIAIVDDMIGAASEGKDLRTYSAAEKALPRYTEEQIGRAWREWGELRVRTITLMLLHYESADPQIVDTAPARAAIGRLPPLRQ
jgi:hypothetical protein